MPQPLFAGCFPVSIGIFEEYAVDICKKRRNDHGQHIPFPPSCFSFSIPPTLSHRQDKTEQKAPKTKKGKANAFPFQDRSGTLFLSPGCTDGLFFDPLGRILLCVQTVGKKAHIQDFSRRVFYSDFTAIVTQFPERLAVFGVQCTKCRK